MHATECAVLATYFVDQQPVGVSTPPCSHCGYPTNKVFNLKLHTKARGYQALEHDAAHVLATSETLEMTTRTL